MHKQIKRRKMNRVCTQKKYISSVDYFLRLGIQQDGAEARRSHDLSKDKQTVQK